MKIMKSIDKKVGNKTYYKYKINLPKQVVDNSKLLNKELKAHLDKEKIIIEKE